MQYEIRMETVSPTLTAVVQLQARPEELAVVVPAACGEVWQFVRGRGIPQPGRHLALFLDDKGNLEVGVEVGQAFTGDGRVVCSRTPAGLVVTTTHVGPYHLLCEAHQTIQRWCAAQGHALAGVSWELYGHMTDGPAQPLTQVFYLLRS